MVVLKETVPVQAHCTASNWDAHHCQRSVWVPEIVVAFVYCLLVLKDVYEAYNAFVYYLLVLKDVYEAYNAFVLTFVSQASREVMRCIAHAATSHVCGIVGCSWRIARCPCSIRLLLVCTPCGGQMTMS
jgi:hypothetical protein